MSNKPGSRKVYLTRAASRGQGRRHEFLTGGRSHRHPNPPTPKFSFSSDLGQFVLKMLENTKIVHVLRKQNIGTEMTTFLGGRTRGFQKWGVQTSAPPPPPSATPLVVDVT